jgi:hypothetical protein
MHCVMFQFHLRGPEPVGFLFKSLLLVIFAGYWLSILTGYFNELNHDAV